MHPMAAPFHFAASGPEAVVLLHGWTGSPAHLRPLGQELNEAGYDVVGPLLAGHGTRVEDMTRTGWRDWVASAAAPMEEVLASGKRLHLIGLSMGAIIALLLAPVYDAASITTIDAPQRVWDRRNHFAWLVRGSRIIRPGHPLVPAPPDLRVYQQQYADVPIGTVADLMDLVKAAAANLWRVTCPALVIQSCTDETVRPISGRLVYDGLSSYRKVMLWLEHSRHVATLDRERDVIRDAVVRHLGETANKAAHSGTFGPSTCPDPPRRMLRRSN
jgi:carboxylesterase